ncbi:MAG: immunoglobulin-like domain-containing protein [Hyalangium sp.]|uniref:immunoglobulin-like domain-containing protein n=1 Tax=Hyalangium sp. TaxID=2028555 RepID=UPI00389A173B
MTLRTVGRALLLSVALTAISCGGSASEPSPDPSPPPPLTARQAVRSTNKVLILGSSVAGELSSREAAAVQAWEPTAQIDVVTPERWSALTATDFMSYRALLIGDAACQSGTAAFQAAIDNRNIWGAVVDGDIALLATDPTSNGTDQLVENGIRHVLNSAQNLTGMYISLGCAYQDATADTAVALLEPFGAFTVQGVPDCANAGHVFEMNNDLLSRDLRDGGLGGAGGCVARSVFTSYPSHTFAIAALAMSASGVTVPGQRFYIDYTSSQDGPVPYLGTPYLLERGSMPVGAGCGMPEAPPSEECDLGDGINGAPATDGQLPEETCSWSCHNHWCGDGQVDTELGEECDNGAKNGRTGDSSGAIGTCTSFCKIPHLPIHPPTALCKNVTVQAGNACGAAADINNGSFDQDHDLVGCTQSPAGPFNLGNTTVTLTCTDQGDRSATCTSVVTVTDNVPPTMTLVQPVNQSLECTKGATYTDPGYSASDVCEGPLPQSSITTTGTVNMGASNTYTLSYQAKDISGNLSPLLYRTVTVADTLPPVMTRLGAEVMTKECGTSYVEQGVTASDQCDGNLSSRVTRTGAVNISAVGDYLLRFNVKDAAGHSAAEVTRTVSVRDSLQPTVTLNTPTSQTVECGSTYVDPSATATDKCVGTLPATVNTSNLDMGVPGNYTLNYKATDPSGNTGVSANRTVTVSDTLAPTLTLNGSATVALECGSTFIDPKAKAIDQCYGDLTGSIVKTGSVDNKVPGSYTLHYNVQDPKNNGSPEVTRTVTVRDTVPPIITMSGPPSQTVECGSAYVDPGATANDACAGPVAAVASSSANANTPGSYTLTYTATDPSGNKATLYAARTVTVSDTAPPTLTLNGSATVALECGSPYDDAGATANDTCFKDLTSRIARTGSVNPGAPGTYTLTFNVSDPAGWSAPSVSRTVTVTDSLAPTLTLAGSLNPQVECGTPYTDPGETAADVCAGDLSSSIAKTGSVNTATPGDYPLSYSVADNAGHSVTASRLVAVRDTLAPQIQLLPGASVLPCNGSPYVDPGATASDLCAGNLTPNMVIASNLDQSHTGQYAITYSVADHAGHTTTAVRPLTVQGTNIHLNDYNLFLLEDYTGGHDVQGKVAAGGNISMTGFSVAASLYESDISQALVAGGNLTLSQGGIWGDTFYGGTYSADSAVVQHRGTLAKGTPINFVARFGELRTLSSQLAGMKVNGTTTVESWGGITLNGTDPSVNVFNVSASAFTGAKALSISAPANSLAVVNIRGTSATLNSFATSFGGGLDQRTVLFHFPEATTISAQGIGIPGTVLAPYARITFNNGSWDGGIYAVSLTGTAEGHVNPLPDRSVCQ